MISLKQLEAIQYIVQLGTFERAAARLNTTQSAISKRVQQLEETLQLTIFDRSERSARLTEEGENLLGLAQEMLALQARMLDLRSSKEMPIRRLRLGVTELSSLTWLPRLISEIRLRYPSVNIEPEVDVTRILYDRLLDESLDLIVAPTVATAPELTVQPLGEVQNVWMAKPGLVLPRQAMTLSDIAQYPIIAEGRKSGAGIFLSRWFKSQGIVFSKVLATDSLTAVVSLAVAGLGIAYLPRACFRPLVKKRKLEILRSNPELPPIPYAAIYRSDRRSAFVSGIAELTRDVADFSVQFQLQN